MEDTHKLKEAQNLEQGIDGSQDNGFKHLPKDTNILSFKSLEREYHYKDSSWYFLATIFILGSVAYFIYDGSFSSAILFMFILSFLYIYGNHPPRVVEIHFSEQGLYINKIYYPYTELNCFWIVTSGEDNVHSLNFELGNKIKRIITIQLHDINDNFIRSILKDKVEEDYEKEEPGHTKLSRFFRL